MPEVATIFTGINTTGPHIYIADNYSILCCDSVGFAAIGSGRPYTETRFMLAGHDRRDAGADTLFLTYLAKKRAKVAPGIGKGTDMITAGPYLGNVTIIASHVVEKLDEIYNRHIAREANAFKRSRKETSRYVEEIHKASAVKQSQGLKKGQRILNEDHHSITDTGFKSILKGHRDDPPSGQLVADKSIFDRLTQLAAQPVAKPPKRTSEPKTDAD